MAIEDIERAAVLELAAERGDSFRKAWTVKDGGTPVDLDAAGLVPSMDLLEADEVTVVDSASVANSDLPNGQIVTELTDAQLIALDACKPLKYRLRVTDGADMTKMLAKGVFEIL